MKKIRNSSKSKSVRRDKIKLDAVEKETWELYEYYKNQERRYRESTVGHTEEDIEREQYLAFKQMGII